MSVVSIVLPTYNGARYLRESVDSCLAQTHRALELIVVDDHSTDDTPQILQSYADPRLRVLRHDTNLGLPRALNTGFAHSTGEFLTWTSDDNKYAPEAIATMLGYLEANPGVDMVYTDHWTIDEQGRVAGRRVVSPPDPATCDMCSPCFLYRRRVYELVGDYDPAFRLAEDYEYWLRVMSHFRMQPLNEALYFYRVHPRSLTSTSGIERQHRVVESARRKWVGPDPYFFPSRYARAVAQAYVHLAFAQHRAGNRPLVRRFLLRSLRWDPRWALNRGVLSILVEAVAGRRLAEALRRLLVL